MLVNTLLLLATCPVSLNCSVTHEQRGALTQCCFNDGPHFQRSGDVETVLFQCITLITFGILYQTSPNLQGSRRNGCEWCVQKYMWSDWELTEISIKKRYGGVGTMLAQCFALITFELVNETASDLQGICGNISRWCLQNYMENGWELTSELASKWITFKNTQSNFTPISIITFVILNQTSPNL